jgi:D-alanyl-D-alanine carboxypeptidase
VAIALAIAVDVLRGGDSGSEPAVSDARLVASIPESPASAAPACVAACETPAPSPTAVPRPCPYCGQDARRWQQLTDVAPPELLGTSAVLMEAGCDAVIFGQRWRERRQPASLAKIATAMIVAENAGLDDIVAVEITGWDLAVENDSTIMGLIAGMRISVEELLYGLLLSSGNDAALELSRHLGGEARVLALMDQRIADLGLTDTRLQNTHGLDAPGAYSTPFDMAVLGRELLRNPLLRQIVGTQFREEDWHELGGLWNGNYLLYIYEDAIGVKTGYTEGAGWSIVSAAERQGRLLVASVFNSADVYWDSMRLFDWAFDNTSSPC